MQASNKTLIFLAEKQRSSVIPRALHKGPVRPPKFLEKVKVICTFEKFEESSVDEISHDRNFLQEKFSVGGIFCWLMQAGKNFLWEGRDGGFTGVGIYHIYSLL